MLNFKYGNSLTDVTMQALSKRLLLNEIQEIMAFVCMDITAGAGKN